MTDKKNRMTTATCPSASRLDLSGVAGKGTQVKPMRPLARDAGCKYRTLIQIMTLYGPDSVPYKYMYMQFQ